MTAQPAPEAWRPRLVALDIDGTLVDVHEQVSSAVRAALERVVDAGVPVVIATGRAAYGTERILDLLELPDGTAVCSNGAVTIRYRPVDVAAAVTFDARPAVRLLLERVPHALIAVEVIGQGYRVNRRFPDDSITGQMWVEPVEQLVAEPVTRVIIYDPDASAEDFLDLAAGLGLHGINYYVGYTAWLDLAPEGVSKAFALDEVAATLGVRPADVLAIGDGRNDVEMLAWAGRGVAMGQAPLPVQGAADDVTETLEREGAARELDRWFG